jgi:D-beta-D-heptose 7-phosphate kinase/D-beta-D-heptose 1-phosphate adenosyltransferase
MSERELITLLQNLGTPRVAVVGDFMLDRYVWGDAGRVSPEAPVPVVHAHREDHRLGGAGNVVANVCELGGTAVCFGLLGEDDAAGEMIEGLNELGAETRGLLRDAERPTIQKIRIMARNQQMLRVDREQSTAISAADAQRMLEVLAAASWDVLVLSDYGKGTLSSQVIEGAIAEARRRGAPSVVDPKHRELARYRGAGVVTPNRAEAEVAAGVSLREPGTLQDRGEQLRVDAGVEALLITLGPEGMFLLDGGQAGMHLRPVSRSPKWARLPSGAVSCCTPCVRQRPWIAWCQPGMPRPSRQRLPPSAAKVVRSSSPTDVLTSCTRAMCVTCARPRGLVAPWLLA